jgi:hypothetical protein
LKEGGFSGAGAECGNCIAVAWVGDAAHEGAPPGAGLGSGDGEFEGRFARRAAEDDGAGEEVAAEGAEFGAAGLAEAALQADAKIVGGDREVTGRFGRPERAAAQVVPPELRPEFLDAVFNVGPAVVAASDLQRWHRGGQVVGKRPGEDPS